MFAKNLENVEVSGIREIFNLAKEIEKTQPVFHFEIGQPSFQVPDFIKNELKQSIDNNSLRYVENKGPLPAREALSAHLEKTNHFQVNPDNIIYTCGANEAVACTLFAFLSPGDEIIIPTPAWSHYKNLALLIGAKPIEYALKAENNYAYDFEEIEQKITSKTKLFLFNNPSNPSGHYYSKETQEKLLNLAEKKGFKIVVDEIYDNYAYEDEFHSIMRLANALDHCIYINGFSKSLGITGLRLGYVTANTKTVFAINKVHQYLTVCTSSIALDAITRILPHAEIQPFLKTTHDLYRTQNQKLKNLFNQNDQIHYGSPQGAFYFFVKYPERYGKSKDFALQLLKECGIAVVPGIVFGNDFEYHFRLSYDTSEKCLEGVKKLIEYIK